MNAFFHLFYGIERRSFLFPFFVILLNVSELVASPMPANVREQLNRVVGTWKMQVSVSAAKAIPSAVRVEVITLEWDANGTALLYQGEGKVIVVGNQQLASPEEFRFSGVFGWDAQGQVVREFGFDNQGGTFFADHAITSDAWSSVTTTTSPSSQGKSDSQVFKRNFTFESADLWATESKNRLMDG